MRTCSVCVREHVRSFLLGANRKTDLMITNQVLKDGSQLMPWFANTKYLTPVTQAASWHSRDGLRDALLYAFGEIKWTAVDTYAAVSESDKANITAMVGGDTYKDGTPFHNIVRPDTYNSIRLQNVSHVLRTPVTEHLRTGVQTFVKTPRGTVSPRYKFEGHQPTDIAEFFAHIQSTMPIEFEWAGSIQGGAAVFAVARCLEPLRLYNGEESYNFLVASNGFLGGGIFSAFNHLSACCNSYSVMLSPKRAMFNYSHRHALDEKALIQTFKDNLALDFTHVASEALRMSRIQLPPAQRAKYFERVLMTLSAARYGGQIDAAYKIPRGYVRLGRNKDGSAKTRELPYWNAYQTDLHSLEECYRNGNGQSERRGMHAAFHAVTFWANHLTKTRKETLPTSQTNSWQLRPGGSRDKIIQSAHKLALAA